MSPELNQQLVDKYPLIFRHDFGIECGDGWYQLINLLCAKIQSQVNWSKCDQVTAAQVKEKFGELRFYHDGGDEYVRGLISMAESMSEVTCEVCGERGELRHRRWIKSLCDRHAEELHGSSTSN